MDRLRDDFKREEAKRGNNLSHRWIWSPVETLFSPQSVKCLEKEKYLNLRTLGLGLTLIQIDPACGLEAALHFLNHTLASWMTGKSAGYQAAYSLLDFLRVCRLWYVWPHLPVMLGWYWTHSEWTYHCSRVRTLTQNIQKYMKKKMFNCVSMSLKKVFFLKHQNVHTTVGCKQVITNIHDLFKAYQTTMYSQESQLQ